MICHGLKTFVDVFMVTQPSSPFHAVLPGGQRQFTPEVQTGVLLRSFWIYISLSCLFFYLTIRSYQWGMLTRILYLLQSSALWS